jgi:DNA-binding LacI/PurR family transcriptional regulator
MTYINQPAGKIAETAFTLLLDEIKNPDTQGEKHLEIPAELIICETCKKG